MNRPKRFDLAQAVMAAMALGGWGTVGCASSPSTNGGTTDGGGGFDGVVIPDGPPSVLTQGRSAALFAADHVAQIDFTVPQGQWEWLQANAKLETYVAARASYDGQSAGLIGLRFKGNYGTLVNCFDPTGKLTCAKLSFKVDFAEYDPDNRFFGLKKLNLHSMINDPTKLHEKLAYELYGASGVIAPRSTWANVSVNGKSYGLFSLVEEIDGRFTDDRWPGNGDGNLYKEAWPTSSVAASYVEKLETNESAGDHRAIVKFAEELAAAPAGQRAPVVARWADFGNLQRYMAVDDAIFNCDGITAFYAQGATGMAWGNHNFFLYQEQARDFFWLVPWDLDATMTVCAPFANVPPWFQAPKDCNQNYAVWGGSWVKAPGCDRLLQALGEDRSGYQAAVDELLAGPFATEALLAKIEQWAEFIRAAQAADPTAGGEIPWQASINQMKNNIPVLRERLAGLRDGKVVPPFTLSVTELNDFEQASASGVALGITALANPNTEIASTLNTTAPLGGLKDIRTDFVYRDAGAAASHAFEQWIYLVLSFSGGNHDLTGTKQIKMRLRTDRPRTVRIDLESTVYAAANSGIKFGWEVQVKDTPTEVTLVLDAATLPSWATVKTDVLANTRKQVNGLAFNPMTAVRDAAGYIGVGKSDPGFFEIDDVQFLTTE